MPTREPPRRSPELPSYPAIKARTSARIREILGHPLPDAEPLWAEPERSGPGSRLVVASYNVHKCVGTDGRFDPDRIAHVIAELKADVVALQEADKRFRVRTGLLDDRTLRQRAELNFLPLSTIAEGHGWHGNAVLVRGGTPTRLERLTLPCAEPRGAVLAEIMMPAGPLRIVAAHLGLIRRWRRLQAEAILEIIDRSDPMPTLLLGDFNEWGPARPRSAIRTLEPFFGPVPPSRPSFPSTRPIFVLDRILGWPEGLVEATAVHDTPLARLASDHLPVKALVNLQSGARKAAAAMSAPS